VLVLAAAGTGKTRTLVYRVAYLVEQGITAGRILLLTFTNRASREMLERAESVVGGRVSGVWGGTFHHMANRILRRYAACLGYTSAYTILDRDDSKKLVTECAKDLKLHGRDFPRGAVLLSLFSSAKNAEKSVWALSERRFGNDGVDASDVQRVYEAYEQRKQGMNAMDFDDLLVNCLRLLQEQEHVAENYQELFLHVLVDEYQDTNALQSQIVDLVAKPERNLLVVGDDFQSIYSWRGADFRNILSFPDRYPDAQVYKLETNYRSVPEILHVANASIAGNPEQFQKTLLATRKSHRRPCVATMRDGEQQARYIAERIDSCRRDGYRLSDIAVLYRAHYQALELERLLPPGSVPYVITSGVRFFEQAHVKDVCAALRVLCFPGDELAFTRLLCLLPGVGIKTAQKLWARVDGAFVSGDAAQRELVRAGLPARARPAWEPVEGVLAAFSGDGLGTAGGEVIYRFAEAFYRDYALKAFDDYRKRLEDIDALAIDAGKSASLHAFLGDVALLTNVDVSGEEGEGGEGGDALRLSTIHQAKGLEWPVVIVLWATEGMFPLARSLEEDEGAGIAEERRLFYVAVTRARDELVLCVPEVRRMRDGGVFYCQPSRFITEIPASAVTRDRAGFL